MMVVLLDPERFVVGEGGILNFDGDFDLNAKLFG